MVEGWDGVWSREGWDVVEGGEVVVEGGVGCGRGRELGVNFG